jgi:DNA-binding CsgD family transcriptional regulator
MALEFWQNVPDISLASSCTLRNCNHFATLLNVINNVVANDLTKRQYEIVELIFRHKCTQIQASKILGIAQPTVNQHLYGKLRKGKHVGGAYQRIRKRIRKRAKLQKLPAIEKTLLKSIYLLLDPKITRRTAAKLICKLNKIK